MTKPKTAEQVLAHKRKLKADQMKRYREGRRTFVLDETETRLIARGLKLASKDMQLPEEQRAWALLLAGRMAPRKDKG